METPSVYIPMDRRQAMARGRALPARSEGSALFADISGFTPLTEALAQELGPRRGAEELTRHLNQVYNAVIAELHRYGGSVISFSGDAITCWLDGDDGRRATACGLSIQQAMMQFAEVRTHSGQIVSLGMKAAVATGPARRFTAGDPEHLVVDVLAGQTLDRLATAEHQAERGEVVVDERSRETLKEWLEVVEERLDNETGDRFWVVQGLGLEVAETPWPHLAEEAYPTEEVRGWLLPPVFERLSGGQGEFLAELRPAVALFLRFSGLNYDDDAAAPEKLDSFVRQVEGILGRYDGNLIQLTVGDKGSYLYAVFGAPIAHEDDVARAASAALELRELAAGTEYLDPVQIGITLGRMRTGAYGSVTQRTYGVLGDATNLSARLMSLAQPGEILVSDQAHEAGSESFIWESMPPVRVKGKSEPITVWRLVGKKRRTGVRLQEPRYSLPMVGRAAEMRLIDKKLETTLTSAGQIVGIKAEAGMGKSRLAAEVIRLAAEKGFLGSAGECQSYGTATGYLVWRSIWRTLFDVDPNLSPDITIERLDRILREIDPMLVRRLPLLGPILNLPIPDNELTSSLEAKIRKSSLEAMLVTCLRWWAASQPIILVLEDCHWLDPLSADLIEVIARAINDLPVFMLLVYRSLDSHASSALRIGQLPHFAEIALMEFSEQEAETLIRLKLAQFFGSETSVPGDLLAQVTTRAAGNPYYIEELLNYLRDRGIDPSDAQALAELDLPSSLYSLILTRIDQLTEQQNATLKIASVIGRLFPAAMVWGVYPELGGSERVRGNLQVLSEHDLTPLDTPDPELTYLFKHVIIQEVAYESLLYSTRAMLHERIGTYIEQNHEDRLDQFLNLLAHHFGHSENDRKKREYLLKAGDAARSVYDNEAAINFYREAAGLLSTLEKLRVYQDLGFSLELVGRWDEAGQVYQEAIQLAASFDDDHALATYQEKMAELSRKQGRFVEAAEWLTKALAGFEALDDRSGVALALGRSGIIAFQRGEIDSAQTLMEESLANYRELGEKAKTASMLSNLSIVARHQRDNDGARALQLEALAIRQELADPWTIAISLINLGNVALDQGHHDEAQARLEEAVKLLKEVGDRGMIANALHNLANVERNRGEHRSAKELYDESLLIYRDLANKLALAQLFEDVGSLAALNARGHRALQLVGAAETLREEIGVPISSLEASNLDSALRQIRESLGEDEQKEAQAKGRAMSLREAVDYVLGT